MGFTICNLLLRFKTTICNSPGRHFSSSSPSKSGFYEHALKVQRPTTINYYEIMHLQNSVSLIGSIELPLKECKTTSGKFGLHTFLRVKATTGPCRHFRVLLKFWEAMAEMSVQHLKPHDFVYVSGQLGSYRKLEPDRKFRHNYTVNVKEINFISQHGLEPACKLGLKVSPEEIMQKRVDRFHLWHIFFSNPYEWWDNRNCKLSPNSPDFTHKDTGEKLWLRENDPLWLKKQIQLQDSGLVKQNSGERRTRWSDLSPMVYDDVKSI